MLLQQTQKTFKSLQGLANAEIDKANRLGVVLASHDSRCDGQHRSRHPITPSLSETESENENIHPLQTVADTVQMMATVGRQLRDRAKAIRLD